MLKKDIELIAEEIKYGAKLAYGSTRRKELWRLYYEIDSLRSSEEVDLVQKNVRVALFAAGMFVGMMIVLLLK